MDAGKAPPCPACGSDRVAWILFGFPDFTNELEADLDAGRVVLGGCCIDEDDPEWQCQACGHEWGQSKLVATLQSLTREAEQRPKSWWQRFLTLFGLTFIEESVIEGFVRRFVFMTIGAGLVLAAVALAPAWVGLTILAIWFLPLLLLAILRFAVSTLGGFMLLVVTDATMQRQISSVYFLALFEVAIVMFTGIWLGRLAGLR